MNAEARLRNLKPVRSNGFYDQNASARCAGGERAGPLAPASLAAQNARPPRWHNLRLRPPPPGRLNPSAFAETYETL